MKTIAHDPMLNMAVFVSLWTFQMFFLQAYIYVLCFQGFDVLNHLFIAYFHLVVVTFML